MTDDVKDGSGAIKKSVHKSLDPVSYFPSVFQNDHHAYCAKKSERLATAVHVVTGFIARDEPLRSALRQLAVDIIRFATDRTKLGELGPETFAVRCAEMAALLSTAESAGLVSAMNAKLIIEEYARLADFVKERYAFIRLQVSDIQDFSIGHQTETKGQTEKKVYRPQNVQAVKDTVQSSSRKADILSLFNTKDKISIKDAVQSVAGVSEKTLQRDLLALVAQGVLIKEGERRWSIYRRAGQGT